MKKHLMVLLTLVVSILFLFSCDNTIDTNTQSDDNIDVYEIDVTNLNNFKCEIYMGQTDKNYVLEGEKAKELYNIIKEYEKTGISGIPAYDSMDPSKDYIYLFFSAEKIENSEYPNEQLGHYGCFTIYTKDVVSHNMSPFMSASLCFQFENGVYDEVNSYIESEFLNKE